MYLTQEQDARVRSLGRNLEIRTGVEFTAAVVGKCDNYPEIPWKAFALGAALGALIVFICHLFRAAWAAGPALPLSLAWVLGGGALTALLTPFWPPLARLFLDAERARAESRQYAQGLFLDQSLFNTRHRRAILLLIGLFERRVVLIPDTGVLDRLQSGQLEDVIHHMVPHLRRGDHFQAIVQGIGRIESMLLAAGFSGSPDAPDQISDELIQQKGTAS
jgi:putative membrane protein